MNFRLTLSDGSRYVSAPAAQPQPTTGRWIGQHKRDDEVPAALKPVRHRYPTPAVWPLGEASDHKVEITMQWQFYIRAINPGRSLQYVAALFGPTLAFTNRKRDDARADWLRRKDLDRPNPDFDRVRTCTGSLLSGVVDGDYLIVDMMDGTRPPPLVPGKNYPARVEDVRLEDYAYRPETHPWLFMAATRVGVGPEHVTGPFPNGAVYSWTGDGKPYTWLPHVANRPIRYPLAYLRRVDGWVGAYS